MPAATISEIIFPPIQRPPDWVRTIGLIAVRVVATVIFRKRLCSDLFCPLPHLQPRERSSVDVTVRRERRWTSAGAIPARELVRSTRYQSKRRRRQRSCRSFRCRGSLGNSASVRGGSSGLKRARRRLKKAQAASTKFEAEHKGVKLSPGQETEQYRLTRAGIDLTDAKEPQKELIIQSSPLPEIRNRRRRAPYLGKALSVRWQGLRRHVPCCDRPLCLADVFVNSNLELSCNGCDDFRAFGSSKLSGQSFNTLHEFVARHTTILMWRSLNAV
jgi:hypothetical protein